MRSEATLRVTRTLRICSSRCAGECRATAPAAALAGTSQTGRFYRCISQSIPRAPARHMPVTDTQDLGCLPPTDSLGHRLQPHFLYFHRPLHVILRVGVRALHGPPPPREKRTYRVRRSRRLLLTARARSLYCASLSRGSRIHIMFLFLGGLVCTAAPSWVQLLNGHPGQVEVPTAHQGGLGLGIRPASTSRLGR